MSDIEQELLEGRGSKKGVVGTVFVAILLIALFAFSTALYSLILGTQRLAPNEELANTNEEDALLIAPPSPYDLDKLMELLKDELDELSEEELKSIADMLDGNIDDMSLAAMAGAIAALYLSEVEVFRVYDYDVFSAMSDYLWKYETFDQFTGPEWECTSAKQLYDFISLEDYTNDYSDSDLLKLKMPLETSTGVNSMVIPSLFPIPFIIDGSFNAPNLETSQTKLYKYDFNSTTADLTFNSEDSVNMSYELFGLADLPTNEELNQTSLDETLTPVDIQNQFLQLPGGKTNYINGDTDFTYHYNILNSIIKPSDNAFQVANKIRNYLQANFTVGFDALMDDPPADGEDVVYWFCEKEEGVWSDFASAFAVFCRTFGVASRFVDGFNSRSVEEIYDEEEGKNTFAVKYKNIYNWAEIYIPTDASGEGEWVQFDILYDSFGGGSPLSDADFNLNLDSNFTEGYRPAVAEINATLTSLTESVEGRQITFTDVTTGAELGSAYTDSNGVASIQIDIDNTQVVGPHIIQADYSIVVTNFTSYIVYGPIDVLLNGVVPSKVNRTITNTTHVYGYVQDPINGQRVKNATVQYVLLNKGTNNKLVNPFDIT